MMRDPRHIGITHFEENRGRLKKALRATSELASKKFQSAIDGNRQDRLSLEEQKPHCFLRENNCSSQ